MNNDFITNIFLSIYNETLPCNFCLFCALFFHVPVHRWCSSVVKSIKCNSTVVKWETPYSPVHICIIHISSNSSVYMVQTPQRYQHILMVYTWYVNLWWNVTKFLITLLHIHNCSNTDWSMERSIGRIPIHMDLYSHPKIWKHHMAFTCFSILCRIHIPHSEYMES